MGERILLIRTGGTIDSESYDDPRNPPAYVKTLKGKHSLVIPTVAELPHHEDVDGFTWIGRSENRFVKDSKKFTPGDVKALADIIRSDDHRYFIITHGTDAMAKNARLLQKKLKGSDKVVVFAGAIVPLSMRREHVSDGVETLRFTLEYITGQPAGVYVAGHDAETKRLGFFDPRQVEKNLSASLADLKFTLSRH